MVIKGIYFKITDLIIISLFLCISVFFVIIPGNSNDKKLILTVDNKSYPLEWGQGAVDLSIYGKNMIIDVGDNDASVIESDCPDQICVHTGWISRCGQIAACLPNKVALRIDCD